jgi:hypothetical protein
MPCTDTAATSAPWTPSTAFGCERSRRSIIARRSSDRTGSAPSGDLHPPDTRAASHERRHEQPDVEPQGLQGDTVERPCDDQREQARLDQHREGGADPEQDVDRQQRPRRPRSSQQARVKSAHGT